VDRINTVDVIDTAGLAKSYGTINALAGVDLRVPRGSIYGFLGPNGAGKTTAMRILVGLLRATGGSATVLGQDAWRESTAIRGQVGYLPGDVRLHEWMTGQAFLSFCNRARGGGAEREVDRLRERFDLNLDRRIRDYSRGMKQKLGLIAAVMHRPALLILDEPTTALDPLVAATLHDELRRAAGEGQTVLFSSHTLSEVEELCDRVAIIRAGRIVEDSRIDDLRKRALRRVELRMEPGEYQKLRTPAAWVELERRDGLAVGNWKGSVSDLLAWLNGLKVKDVTITPPDLEDLFSTYYRE
jgi:ABC-2 type transport system ATP-binding protein